MSEENEEVKNYSRNLTLKYIITGTKIHFSPYERPSKLGKTH